MNDPQDQSMDDKVASFVTPKNWNTDATAKPPTPTSTPTTPLKPQPDTTTPAAPTPQTTPPEPPKPSPPPAPSPAPKPTEPAPSDTHAEPPKPAPQSPSPPVPKTTSGNKATPDEIKGAADFMSLLLEEPILKNPETVAAITKAFNKFSN